MFKKNIFSTFQTPKKFFSKKFKTHFSVFFFNSCAIRQKIFLLAKNLSLATLTATPKLSSPGKLQNG